MKKCLLISFILCANFTFAQINESFDDGDFTNGTLWQGSTHSFKVNESKQLQSLKADAPGSIYLSTTNPGSTDLSWEFYVQLNFAPSSSNYVRVYLISDTPDLNSASNGYFVQIGEDGSNDSFDLFKKQGSSASRVINGKDGRAGRGKVQARLRIDRTADGKWQLYSMNSGENQWVAEGSVTDRQAIQQPSWFGLQCIYTKTRSDQFIFDDIRISAQVPGEPPQLPEEEEVEGSQISPGDILISEVLFNPKADGVDFVEIYNYSNKTFNLQDLSLATLKNDSITSVKIVSNSPRALKPEEYLALSTDPEKVKAQYHTEAPAAFIKMASLPAFNNTSGTVILLASAEMVDRFDYTEKMHAAIIKDPEGVSLERLRFDRPANESGNFRSAAASVGYATPGYENSQFSDGQTPGTEIKLASKTFSPDNDGYEDVLTISYSIPEAGSIGNVLIFNDKGVLITQLIRNQSMAREGSLTWNGLNAKGNLASPGIYVVYLEIFDLNGRVKKYRKPCVLAAKL